jgi:hypothetical protein
MNDTVWIRLTALSGLVFGGLIIAASSVQGSAPGLDDPSRQVFTYIRDHRSDLKLSAVLFGVAMSAVLFWAWGLYGALRNAEHGNSSLAVVAVAGGVLAAAMTVVASTVIATTALRINTLSPAGALFYFTLYRFTQAGTNFGLAVLIGAAAIASLRGRLFSRWFTIVSVLLAMLTLVGGLAVAYAGDAIQTVGGAALILDVVWIMIVSVRLLRRPELAVSQSTPIARRET